MTSLTASLSSLLLSLWLLIAAHEAGHFYMAYFLRRPIAKLKIGAGPLLYSRMWKGIVCEFRLIPLNGHVALVYGSRNKWVDIAVHAAGPFVNLLLAAPLYLLGFTSIANASLFLGVYNLYPIARWHTDGYNIVRRWARTSLPKDVI